MMRNQGDQGRGAKVSEPCVGDLEITSPAEERSPRQSTTT